MKGSKGGLGSSQATLTPAVITCWAVIAHGNPNTCPEGWQITVGSLWQMNNKTASYYITHYLHSKREQPEYSFYEIKGKKNSACNGISNLIYLCLFVTLPPSLPNIFSSLPMFASIQASYRIHVLGIKTPYSFLEVLVSFPLNNHRHQKLEPAQGKPWGTLCLLCYNPKVKR